MGGGGIGDEPGKGGKRKRNSAYIQEAVKDEPKRTRVHAQRKFAQGAGGGASPLASPLKEVRTRATAIKADTGGSSSSSSSVSSFPAVQRGERPKTEDFLTFLCLRGTDLLPPELDFFNQATVSQGNDSSDECSSDQDNVSKDPEVDKNGVARKSSKRLSALQSSSKFSKKESSPSVKKREIDGKRDNTARKTRSNSQDSHSSPERSSGTRKTRSQVQVARKLGSNNIEIKATRAARKNGRRAAESSEESESEDHEEDMFEADEEASSRESSRRPLARKSEAMNLREKYLVSKMKQREGRSTSRDSSASKESIRTNKINNPQASPAKESLDPEKEDTKEDHVKDDSSKSPKDKRDSKKKHKNKSSKTSLKDLQNILLEEAKRKIAEDVPGSEVCDTPLETSETSSKQPSCSPADSDTPDSEERITISQKTGYISVKPRSSLEQTPEDAAASEAGQSPQRRNSGSSTVLAAGKKVARASERVPTPPRKILPKNNEEKTPAAAVSEPASSLGRTNHLPVGVIGAAGLSNRLTHPVALSKSSPVSNLSQPLMIQTSASGVRPMVTASSVTQHQPQQTIIVPAGSQGPMRMPVQMAAVPLQVGVRPMVNASSSGFSNMQGIPIIGPGGVQIGIPVTMPSLPSQPVRPVVTVPTFVRSGYTAYGQPLVASVAPGGSGQLPAPQTITMPSGTTIQYNVPSSCIKQPPLSSTTPPAISSPLSLASPGPPTLSPQIPTLSPHLTARPPAATGGSTTVTRNVTPVQDPPVLTPPVRRELLAAGQSSNTEPLAPASMMVGAGGQTSYSSPPYVATASPYDSPVYHHSPGSHPSPSYPQLASPPSAHPPLYPQPGPGAGAAYGQLSPQVQYSYQTSQQAVYQQQQQPVLLSPHQPLEAPKPPSEPPSLHSPLTHSSAQYSGSGKKRKSTTGSSEPKSSQEEVIVVSDAKSESSESSSSTTVSSSKKRTNADKMLKSKLGSAKERQTKTFDLEDNSSPFAFDDNPDGDTPSAPFRKTSSPLKPPAMIKKSLISSKAKKQTTVEPKPQQTHADLKPTGSKNKQSEKSLRLKAELDKARDQLSVDCDVRPGASGEATSRTNPEDTSSSDNDETTYFIPLKNSSGQSFGVSLKLGTDGPCGPNQKVIMTAKLVTDTDSKPTRAKILGAKTTETSLPTNREPLSPVQNTSTPIKETLTPRKMMMTNTSPQGNRMRRALSPALDQADVTTASAPGTDISGHDESGSSGKRRPNCLIGKVDTGHRFPRLGQHAMMMEAPTFRPTEAEFADPLKYIQKIRGYAEQFGMCRIIPPSSFKPECNVDDDMRFTAYNQYINRMMSRAGQNSKETAAIKKYLETQNCDTRNHPLVGGLEVDLPALYHAVQSFGGLSEVIQKKKWNKIADYMRVPRGSNVNAAANKLDDIYVKWLLPYDTLSSVERAELIRLVEEEWADKAEKSRVKEESGSGDEDEEDEDDDDEDQEAVVKGKSTSLTQFYRVAKNLMSSIFRSEDPPHHIVEDEFWKIVSDKDIHLQVCQGSIDTGHEGYGFPIRNSQYTSHPWNLKQLTNNPRSVLRAMGRVMGVTQPTLHVGMLFTTGCWYRDPHGLPWVEFLHTGAPKIWYGIPDDHSLAFYTAMKQLVPGFCKNRKIWLPSDTTMVSPSYLVKHGVSVARAVQQPGQFVVVFPRSYTSSVCTGYNVSESVYYAPTSWLAEVENMFQDIRDSQEPMMFPLEKILFALASDSKATKYVLESIKPKIEKIRDREVELRNKVTGAGVKTTERLQLQNKTGKDEEDEEYECYVCNANLYVALLANEKEEVTYCLPHGLEYIKENKNQIRHCKLLYTHTIEEIKDILSKVTQRLKTKNYTEEHDEDIPIKEEDIEDYEEEDYVDQEDLKPRERAMPSYIKKEKKPALSSESEVEDEDAEEAEVEDNSPKITEDDYLGDDIDPAVIAALFAEADEVVRPSAKRKAPKERKISESTEESEDEEEDAEEEEEEHTAAKSKHGNSAKKKKDIEKSKTETKAKTKEAEKKKAQKEKQLKEKQREEKEKLKSKSKPKNVEPSKSVKRKIEESPKRSKPDAKRKASDNSKENSKKKVEETKKKPSVSSTKSTPDKKKQQIVAKTKTLSKKGEVNEKVAAKDKVKSQVKEDTRKSLTSRSSKEEKSSSKKKESKDDKSKQRRSKKRKVKSMDAADQFNLLDIILTETDDENYCSASDRESKESSSDDEWT